MGYFGYRNIGTFFFLILVKAVFKVSDITCIWTELFRRCLVRFTEKVITIDCLSCNGKIYIYFHIHFALEQLNRLSLILKLSQG